MGTTTLPLELPDEVIALLGSPQAAADRAREVLVLDLLRQGRISQGRAAALLGLTRHDVLRLMVEHQIPSGPVSIDELRTDLEAAERHLRQG
jgi:predicted HTH domain antitoxin